MKTRLILSILLVMLGSTVAWFNIQSQREQVLVNTTGIEVTGALTTKRQVLRSSGRGSSYVNVFTVSYFDKIPDEAREPLILEAFGKEIEIGKGAPYIGDFHSYDIENVPSTIYKATNEGDSLSILYLPDNPDKVWLKATVAGKTEINFLTPSVIMGVCLLLTTVLLLFKRPTHIV